MDLTEKEKKMLDGEYGDVIKKSMQILVTLGKIYGAERMIEINNAHSPGVSYRVAGDAGLNYVKDASQEAVFKVPTTLNTIGIDSENWEDLGFDKEFSLRQLEMLEAYRKMEGICTYSCTPYLNGNIPRFGEHVAWGESSAVAYVNSVIGARTNREGGPSALAAAVTGRVPAYGYHLDCNRKGNLVFEIEMELKNDVDYAVLVYYSGQIAGRKVPVITGINKPVTLENLKALSAALASSGAVALFHVVGITPEAPTLESVIDVGDSNIKHYKFGKKEYDEALKKFTLEGEVGLVVLGCPHCSIVEFKNIAAALKNKKVKSDVWVCTSRQVKKLADKMGYTKDIEDSGAVIVCDTCPILCPTSSKGYKTIATNSAKLAHYAPGLWNVSTGLRKLEDCVNIAINGNWGDTI
jgi:predicted aconitase